jgi:hypothetical protein
MSLIIAKPTMDLKMYRELEEKFKGFLREYLKAHKAFPSTYIEDVWAKTVGFTDTQIKYGEAVTPLQNARNYFKFDPRGKKEFAELTGKPTNAKDAAPDKAKRKEMEKEIRNITNSISRGFYHDEQFLATRMVADALRKVGYRVEVTGGNYFNNGKSKEYKIRAEKEGEVFNGAIYLMAAGTIDDPFKRYDVSVMW